MAVTPLHLTDEDITTEWRDRSGPVVASAAGPTEAEDDRDLGGSGDADTGDLPTGDEENLDVGGPGGQDTGDEASGPTEAGDDRDQGGSGDADTGDEA